MMRRLVAGVLAGAALLAAPSAMAGKTVISLDADASVQRGKLGPGYALRLGKELKIPMLKLTPEAGISVQDLAENMRFRTFAGARLGFGEILVPSVYGHLGYAFASPGTPAELSPDIGAALDFTAIPVIDLGVHVQHTFKRFDTTTFGLHVSAKF